MAKPTEQHFVLQIRLPMQIGPGGCPVCFIDTVTPQQSLADHIDTLVDREPAMQAKPAVQNRGPAVTRSKLIIRRQPVVCRSRISPAVCQRTKRTKLRLFGFTAPCRSAAYQQQKIKKPAQAISRKEVGLVLRFSLPTANLQTKWHNFRYLPCLSLLSPRMMTTTNCDAAPH